MDLTMIGVAMSVVAAWATVDGGELPKADAILEKVEAKSGPAAARTGMKGLVMKGTITISNMPGKGTFEEVYLGTQRMKASFVWAGMGSMTQGTNGEMSWSTDLAMGVTVRSGVEQAAVQRYFAIGRRAPWKSLYAKAATKGKADVNGRPHFEITMTPATGKPETWFVDAESYVVSRVDLALPDPMGGEIPMEFHYTDWKEIGGILFPQLKTQKVASMELAFRYDSITPNANVTSEQVAPGADVLEALKNPKKQTPQAPTTGGECSLETVKKQPVATVRMTIPASEVSKNLASMLPEVASYLGTSGAPMAGPPFSRYHKIEGDQIDLEAGIPVQSPVTPKGRILASELPAGKAAMTWHIGPYHELPKTYEKLKAWMKEQSLESAGGFWEIYWTDPGLEPDPAKWRTQIFWPVK